MPVGLKATWLSHSVETKQTHLLSGSLTTSVPFPTQGLGIRVTLMLGEHGCPSFPVAGDDPIPPGQTRFRQMGLELLEAISRRRGK